MLQVVAADDSIGGAVARVRRHRQERPDRANDQKDCADKVDVEACRLVLDAPDEHGAKGEQEEAESNRHVFYHLRALF